jgi:hypothetical protein
VDIHSHHSLLKKLKIKCIKILYLDLRKSIHLEKIYLIINSKTKKLKLQKLGNHLMFNGKIFILASNFISFFYFYILIYHLLIFVIAFIKRQSDLSYSLF